MAESKMGEEEAHCNPELEMIKEVRKNVNVTAIIVLYGVTDRLLETGATQ